ncbi:hypothetical protein DMUE_4099 [Dictyocoela muelleri]|nr:hypothetical protein DMUE_4099 [Dictyocoela muelleri]
MNSYISFITTSTKEELFRYMQEKKLILDDLCCQFCGVSMVIKHNKDAEIGYNFRCLNYKCSQYQTTKSILTGSFLKKFRSHPRKVLLAIYFLCVPILVKKTAKLTGLSRNTVSAIKKELILKIKAYFESNSIRLGGVDAIVHIDETMLFHAVKYHRGRIPREKVWALTMIDTFTNPSRGYAKIIQARDANTLLPVIKSVVFPGSIIHTDEWASYNSLSQEQQYRHDKITHKFNFVDPKTGVQTQSVEAFNNKLKNFIKLQLGCKEENRGALLDYFLFLGNFRENAYEKAINLIRNF